MRTFFLCSITFLLTFTLQAQCTVVKFNGDTLYFDQITPNGKVLACRKSGQDKVKINASEVSYYTVTYKMWVQNEGEKKAHEVDTVKKCFIPKDGYEYTVEMENDSVYLASMNKEINGVPFQDFHIYRKKDNSEVLEIKKDKSAIETLKQYFGGSCTELDNKITELRPKFQKKVFPYDEWYTLMYTWNTKCKK